MTRYSDDDDDKTLYCEGCNTLGRIISGNSKKHTHYIQIRSRFFICEILTAANKKKAVNHGAIDAILNGLRRFTRSEDACSNGCRVLWEISEGDRSIQKEILKKDGLDALFSVLEYCDPNYHEECFTAIEMLFSSNKLHSKFLTIDILDAVRGYSEENREQFYAKQSLLSLMRIGDPRARYAVAKGICVNEAPPRPCNECEWGDGICSFGSWIRQRAFRCRTCDGDEIKFYCETCRSKFHEGHECEEFFFHVECATESE